MKVLKCSTAEQAKCSSTELCGFAELFATSSQAETCWPKSCAVV